MRLLETSLLAENQALARQNVDLALALEDCEACSADLRRRLELSEEERARGTFQVRRLELELRTAISKLAELRSELRQAQSYRDALKALLADRVAWSPPDPAEDEPDGATPGEVYCQVLQEVLGPPGRSLVEELFRRCQVDLRSTRAEEVARVTERLQPVAVRLARSPDQVERVKLGLNRCRKRMHLHRQASSPLQGAPSTSREGKKLAPQGELLAQPDSL
ncbi:MAG: hypothetical protein AMXMBFR33_52850 [Candidatus Xenobia bacterium]